MNMVVKIAHFNCEKDYNIRYFILLHGCLKKKILSWIYKKNIGITGVEY
uniref:Uncharacterized protein n=1 Tax=Anguilla anguilla TaxID=7936 RepID=A0A0E9W9S6_ANGAN